MNKPGEDQSASTPAQEGADSSAGKASGNGGCVATGRQTSAAPPPKAPGADSSEGVTGDGSSEGAFSAKRSAAAAGAGPGEPGANQQPGRSRKHRSRSRPPRGQNSDVYCALDLGTNNCRLLVARPSRRGFFVIDAFSRIIRLGEGVSASGRLSDIAMSRTINALRVCAAKMARNGVARSRLVATEACRVAANRDEFLERVREDVGLDIEVLSRENEAKLAVSGCASLIDGDADLALVFDIGGGSSELIWLDLTRRRQIWQRSLADRLEAQNCIAAWTSLPVGVVTLAEKFGGRFVDEAVFEQMVDCVLGLLAEFDAEHNLQERTKRSKIHLLGTSGTVTTVAGIHLGLPRYDRMRVDGCWLDTSDVKAVTTALVGCNYDERVAEPCVGRDRAELVLAGCAILEALLRMWPCERLRVADRGLREGMLAHMMAEDGVYRYGRRRYGSR